MIDPYNDTETKTIILEILRLGTMRIRQAGWAGDARRGAIEADHIHNLPDYLFLSTPGRLAFYWEVEKAAFEEASRDSDIAAFRPLWDELRSSLTPSPTRAT